MKRKLTNNLMSDYCPQDPRLGYFTFNVHPKHIKKALAIFAKEPDVDRAEIVDGNIRLYYKEINNA